MVRWNIKTLIWFVLAHSTLSAMLLDTSLPKYDNTEEQKKKSKASTAAELIEFKFDQKNLKDILNDFAQKRSFNIIYPTTDSITSKVTFDAGKKLTMAEAWEFLIMLLDQAGFSLVPHGAHTYMLMANKKAYTEPLPLYFNTDYTLLPDTAEKIRYVYYFSNIQLAKQQSEINSILTTIFSSQDVKDAVIYDQQSNSIIFTAKSENIKIAMRLLIVFDETGFQEAVEVLKLEYAQAAEVAQILKSMVDASGAKKTGAVPLSTGGSKVHMFSELASVVDLDPKNVRKLNSVVIMGKTTDVEAIKNFIKKYLDVPQQKGKSFYHVIELQWLKASDFANNVLSTLTQGGSGQSTGTGTSPLAFDPVKVVPETASQAGGTGVHQGGNRLVIAATERDWKRIEELIKRVDVPQKQVIIEALIMDLNLKVTKNLASQLRTRGICPAIFPKHMQAQANMLTKSIIEGEGNMASLEADLSRILAPEGTSDQITPGTVSNVGVSGSTIFTVGQNKAQTNGVWGFFQLLSKHESAKVLSRPVIIAKNNKKASVSSEVTKNIPGGTTGNLTGTVNFSADSAPIKIDFTPLISNNDTVNLQIDITLNSYTSPKDEKSATKFTRTLNTNVFVNSGEILILGGLSKERNERSKQSIPLLEKIPILGNLTSSRSKLVTKEQLFILIRPTIVAPRTEGGMGFVTQKAVNFMNSELAEGEDSFSNLKDPITRWFFNEDEIKTSEMVQNKITNFSLGYEDIGRLADVQITPRAEEQKELEVKWFSSKDKESSATKSKEMEQIASHLQNITNPFETEDRLTL